MKTRLFPLLLMKRSGRTSYLSGQIRGTFFVILDPESGDHVPDDMLSVKVGVEPVSGRLKEAVYGAGPQRVRRGARYFTEVRFDQGEMWKMRVIIEEQNLIMNFIRN